MNHNYSREVKKPMSMWLITLLVVLSVVVGSTLAYFFSSDFASKFVGMSGAVKIEAVGKGTKYDSIEDMKTISNLVIELSDNYSALIPGMEIDMQANCKVYKSTTKPLLRARLNMELTNPETTEAGSDEMYVMGDLFGQLSDIIIENDEWYLHTDGYFYYLGDITQPNNVQGGGVHP